jgi:hypothetical protein
VKTIVREKLTKTQGIHSVRRRWHLDRLKDEDLKQTYQREIQGMEENRGSSEKDSRRDDRREKGSKK